MQLNTIDQIVRRSLLEKNLSIHWYAEYLYHASAAVRELTIDTLRIINTVNLPLNSQFAADLPVDYMDEVMVGIPYGDELQPVPKRRRINPLRNADQDGNYTTYGVATSEGNPTFTGYIPGIFWFWNFNEYGEPTGRWFGSGGGAKRNGYSIIPERRQIQFTESFTSSNAVLMYISDGQSVSAATQLTPMAFACIQSYMDWKSGGNRAVKDSAEARTFYNEKRLLRARMNDMGIDDVKQILRQNYKATIKS